MPGRGTSTPLAPTPTLTPTVAFTTGMLPHCTMEKSTLAPPANSWSAARVAGEIEAEGEARVEVLNPEVEEEEEEELEMQGASGEASDKFCVAPKPLELALVVGSRKEVRERAEPQYPPPLPPLLLLLLA